jgi:hypothetical protein
LSKQVRSEYFNLELLLFNALHDLSMALTRVPIQERNKVLREQLHNIDDNIIRGLYFPLLPAAATAHTHYKVLRLLPDDCWTLASRDKAPFLMHVEVAYSVPEGSTTAAGVTGAAALAPPPLAPHAGPGAASPSVTTGPPATKAGGNVPGAISMFANDIYTVYKPNAEIMRDAMQLAGISIGGGFAASSAAGTGAAAASGAGTPNTAPNIVELAGGSGVAPSSKVSESAVVKGEATAAAKVTAAAIAHMKDAVTSPTATTPNVRSPAGGGTDSGSSVAQQKSPPPPPTLVGSLAANPAANVQANGLNIVSDDPERAAEQEEATAGHSSREDSEEHAGETTAGGRAKAASVSPVGGHSSGSKTNAQGNSMARSRSATEVLRAGETEAIAVAATAGSSAVNSAATASERHFVIEGQGPSSPSLGQILTSSKPSSSSMSPQPPASSPTAAAAAAAAIAPPPQSSPAPPNGGAPQHAASCSALVSSSGSGVVSKPLRTVPQPNPFRPRRSPMYPTGPTLCDAPFATLSAAFGESFLAKKQRVYASSPFAATHAPPRWDVVSVIFKGGDDLRQEVLAMQFIASFDRIWRAAHLPLWLRPYAVVCTSADSGLIETIPDAVSVDSLKKRLWPNWTCLTDFFAAYFGGAELAHIIEGAEEFNRKYPQTTGMVTYQTALRNFVESMAAYSIISFLLQVKDRHNGMQQSKANANRQEFASGDAERN